jgi:hypothetical protein
MSLQDEEMLYPHGHYIEEDRRKQEIKGFPKDVFCQNGRFDV